MPKKAYLAEHLSSEELKDRYRSRKISLGWTIKNAAVAVGLDYQYSFRILKKYNELGEEGVKNLKKKSAEHRRGKEPLLKEE
nr:helix-turn-helix domain-containing protein [Microcystis aeruginosa SX13-01]